MTTDELRSDKLRTALDAALAGGPTETLFVLLERASGLPGPRPNVELMRAVGARIAAAGRAGDALVDRLEAGPDAAQRRDPHPAARCVSLPRYALFALAASASLSGKAHAAAASRALSRLHDRSDEPEHEKRDSVIEALALVVEARGDEVAIQLSQFMDGFLHAHVALEALTRKGPLATLKDPAILIARFEEAFALADAAPRSADRAQGVRLLRASMPAQIARAIVRFAELEGWLETKLELERPETREVVASTVALLRKTLGEGEADRLRARHDASAKPPRDPRSVVPGTRKRSRGRR